MAAFAARFIVLFVASLCANAQAPGPFLEDLTWVELRAAIAAGRTTILVPIGGTEQNGPHMALGKHNRRVAALAERIAARLGNALVAPVVAYVPEGGIDPPTQHMKFPGTVTVPDATFERTLESAARSFRAHGFRDIVFLGDHGGYQGSLRRVAQRLDREGSKAGGVRVHHLEEFYRASSEGFAKLLRAEGFSAAAIGEHAGLADTALTLELAPAMVRRDKFAEAKAAGSGARGDPSAATAELGRKGAALIVDASVEAITRATRR